MTYLTHSTEPQGKIKNPQGIIKTQITDLQLQHPFKIARRATDAFRQVISVEIDGGIGEAAPARFYG